MFEKLRQPSSHINLDNTSDTAKNDPNIDKDTNSSTNNKNEPPKTLIKTNELINLVKSSSNMTGIYLEKADDITLNENTLTIKYNDKSIYSDNIQKPENMEKIRNLVKRKYNCDVKVDILVDNKTGINNDAAKSVTNSRNDIIESKPLKDALKIFGGKIVKINKGEN